MLKQIQYLRFFDTLTGQFRGMRSRDALLTHCLTFLRRIGVGIPRLGICLAQV